MFAVIRTGGKQYKVKKDDKIKVEKLEGKAGASVELGDVLFMADGKSSTFGDKLKGAKVMATIVEQARNDKIIIFKKKRRQNYRRKRGHRQEQTIIQITDIKAA